MNHAQDARATIKLTHYLEVTLTIGGLLGASAAIVHYLGNHEGNDHQQQDVDIATLVEQKLRYQPDC